jgi:hypothetical protein
MNYFDSLLSVSDVARTIPMSNANVIHHIQNRHLKAKKVGGRFLITSDDLRVFLALRATGLYQRGYNKIRKAVAA